MPKLHIRKGDTVLVISGKESGKRGKVIAVEPEKNRAIVEKINIVKRHTRPTQRTPQGGIMEKEAPINTSNLMVVCEKCKSPTRIAKRLLDGGKKIRVCKKCGESLG